MAGGGEAAEDAAGRREPGPAWRWDLVVGAGVAVVAGAAALLPAVPQDPAYHAFADGRTLAGIPNALDVLSSAAFALVGGAGLLAALRRAAFPDARARAPWIVLFASVAVTASGSAWYHLAPTNARLVWDRLPMAIGFMALLAALVGERFGAAAGRRTLPRLALAGAASVAWWALGEARGAGNLLPYLAVQAGALAAIPVLLLGRPREIGPRAPWLLALGLYVLAKGFEVADAELYAALGVSGHTLKHLAAAAGVGVLALEVWRRGRYRAGAGGRGSRSSMLEKSLGGT